MNILHILSNNNNENEKEFSKMLEIIEQLKKENINNIAIIKGNIDKEKQLKNNDIFYIKSKFSGIFDLETNMLISTITNNNNIDLIALHTSDAGKYMKDINTQKIEIFKYKTETSKQITQRIINNC